MTAPTKKVGYVAEPFVYVKFIGRPMTAPTKKVGCVTDPFAYVKFIGRPMTAPYEESRICGGSVCVCKIYRAADDRPYEVSAVWWCVGATIGRPL